MRRRNFLVLSSVAASSLLTGCIPMLLAGGGGMGGMFTGGGMGITSRDTPVSTSTTNNFKSAGNKLAIPPLLEGKKNNGTYHYDLFINKAQHRFFPHALTNTYAINGTYLAPTLKLINKQDVSINYTNNLDESTTMHGHGMHLPPSMEGSPHQSIEAHSSWSARYRVNQKACTNWYHPHAEGKTAQQVYKGLAGFIIIEETTAQ